MVCISNSLALFSSVLFLVSLTQAATFPKAQDNMPVKRDGKNVFNIGGTDHKNFLEITQMLQADDMRELNVILVQEKAKDVKVTGQVKKNVAGQGISVCTNGATTPRDPNAPGYPPDKAIDVYCFVVVGRSGDADVDDLEVKLHKFDKTNPESNYQTSDKTKCTTTSDWSHGSDMGSARATSCFVDDQYAAKQQ